MSSAPSTISNLSQYDQSLTTIFENIFQKFDLLYYQAYYDQVTKKWKTWQGNATFKGMKGQNLSWTQKGMSMLNVLISMLVQIPKFPQLNEEQKGYVKTAVAKITTNLIRKKSNQPQITFFNQFQNFMDSLMNGIPSISKATKIKLLMAFIKTLISLKAGTNPVPKAMQQFQAFVQSQVMSLSGIIANLQSKRVEGQVVEVLQNAQQKIARQTDKQKKLQIARKAQQQAKRLNNQAAQNTQKKGDYFLDRFGITNVGVKQRFKQKLKMLTVTQFGDTQIKMKGGVARRRKYFSLGRLGKYTPIGKQQKYRRTQRIFPQIAARNLWQRRNLTYVPDQQMTNPQNRTLKNWAEKDFTKWDDTNKRWMFTRFGQNLAYKTDQQFKKGLQKALQQRDTKFTQEYVVKNIMPKMVRRVYQSDTRFYRYGIGPAFGRKGQIYAGRYMDQINGHLKTIPKPSLKFINPLSYQQMNFYKKSILIYYWNKYIDAQAQYQKWQKVNPLKFRDNARLQFVKSYVTPSNSALRILNFCNRILKFQLTMQKFAQISDQSYKNMPLFQKGIFIVAHNKKWDLDKKFRTWALNAGKVKQRIIVSQEYKQSKNKQVYLSLQMAKAPQFSKQSWQQFYNEIVNILLQSQSATPTKYRKNAIIQLWIQKYQWANITQQKPPRMIKQYANFVARQKQNQPQQIKKIKQQIQKKQIGNRRTLVNKYMQQLQNPAKNLNQSYKTIFQQQPLFNTIQQQLHADIQMDQTDRNQIRQRGFYNKRQYRAADQFGTARLVQPADPKDQSLVQQEDQS